jgi:DNA modification methylase
MNTAKIIVGDNRLTLDTIPEKSVQTVITSPPYWGLRDYGNDDQIGLEESPEQYVAEMVEVFAKVWRVLADDGTLWLNLGDSYAGNNSRASNNGRAGFGTEREGTFVKTGAGLKPKDLVGIPWRVAFALQQAGWYLRSEIIWHKPNPMPESVTDRPTKSHEHIFLLSKSQTYFYDAEAIKEPVTPSTVERLAQNVEDQEGSVRANGGKKDNGNMKAVGSFEFRNKRDVWTVATRPFKGAHFATYPKKLIEPCVLAGSKPGDTVLDPFSGSGTTGIVSIQNGRNYIGLELSPEYASISEQRIYDEVGLMGSVEIINVNT